MMWYLILIAVVTGIGVMVARSRVRGASRSRPPGDSRWRRLRRPFQHPPTPRTSGEVVRQPPYAFSYGAGGKGRFCDLSQDLNLDRLTTWKLPVLRTPDDIAQWLGLPVNRLAWLAHRCRRGRPEGVQQSHYHYRWLPKASGGMRLIESPKRELKAIQRRILKEILQAVPVPAAAHGFVRGRSIKTHAVLHERMHVLVRIDLRDFYASVGFNRVVAIFRTIGYPREAALWLARLTTAALPTNLAGPPEDPGAVWRYRRRHLPQGAPTSPALANLSAYWLDKRLTGLARAFGANYSRYADDLTFSGDDALDPKLRVLIQLIEQVVRDERFHSHRKKRRVLRRHQRQVVTGVVVNDKPNVSRRDFDQLKAVLHNCVQFGPASQNREGHAHFAAHLRGRIAHVQQLNPSRGAKLLAVYGQIDWGR
uniref:RNA-directed DNA polymerase n=1 Tax=Schlesneria paludicola TaxID=360056 RepID=A0A7C2JZL9_9PLAN